MPRPARASSRRGNSCASTSNSRDTLSVAFLLELGGPFAGGLHFVGAVAKLSALVVQSLAGLLDLAPRLGESVLESLLDNGDPDVCLISRRFRLLPQGSPLRNLV